MVGHFHLNWVHLIRCVSADVCHDGIGNQLVFLQNPNKDDVVAVREASEKLLDESQWNVFSAKKQNRSYAHDKQVFQPLVSVFSPVPEGLYLSSPWETLYQLLQCF